MVSLSAPILRSPSSSAHLPAVPEAIGKRRSPKTIEQIQRTKLCKDRLVTLVGRITRHTHHGLYEFSDGTGTVCLAIDARFTRLPAGLPVNQGSQIEVYGRYFDEALDYDKIKVFSLRPAK